MRNVRVMVFKNQSGSRSTNVSLWSAGIQPGKGRQQTSRGLLCPSPAVTKAAAAGSWKLRYSEGLPEAGGETRVTWTGVQRGQDSMQACALGKLKRPKGTPERTLLLWAGMGFPHVSGLGEQWLVLGRLAVIPGNRQLLHVWVWEENAHWNQAYFFRC